jgi:hypothetical protein
MIVERNDGYGFSGDQKVLVKLNDDSIFYGTFSELEDSSQCNKPMNVLSNGSWVRAKLTKIQTDTKEAYKITSCNGGSIIVSSNYTGVFGPNNISDLKNVKDIVLKNYIKEEFRNIGWEISKRPEKFYIIKAKRYHEGGLPNEDYDWGLRYASEHMMDSDNSIVDYDILNESQEYRSGVISLLMRYDWKIQGNQGNIGLYYESKSKEISEFVCILGLSLGYRLEIGDDNIIRFSNRDSIGHGGSESYRIDGIEFIDNYKYWGFYNFILDNPFFTLPSGIVAHGIKK